MLLRTVAQNPPPSPQGGCPPAEPAFYLAGPTGVGKSELAVRVAERIGAEIVGADAFQVYAGLPILTAHPSPDLLARVPHHLVGEIPLSESFNLAEYLRLAGRRIAEIRARKRIPLVVGGTGLYLRSLIHGLADLPQSDPELRSKLEQWPLLELHRELAKLDPEGAATIDSKNPRRLIRALEVCLLTGKPFSSFREEWRNLSGESPASGVVLLRNKEDLSRRIDQRVLQMFAEGVVEEVRAAHSVSQTARQALGFQEIERLLAGEISAQECIATIQQATRRYAKRQRTWFRREPWLQPMDLSGSGQELEAAIANAAVKLAP